MNIDYSYMRPMKAKALKAWYDNGFFEKPELQILKIHDATILPLRKENNDGLQFGKGGVIADDQYVELSGIEKRVGGYYEHKVTSKRPETVVYCGAFVKQWGHFLIEGVARLWYFLEEDSSVDKYIFIAARNSETVFDGNYREFLELLGVWKKVEIIYEPTAFETVIVPELGYSRKYFFSKLYKAVFDKVVETALEEAKTSDDGFEKKKRIFLSRSKLNKAVNNEIGLDLLDHYFEKNGFMLLYPEQLSLRQLICYLRYAEVFAAESGTLPHNTLFCKDEMICYIVERQTAVNEIQANIDVIKDLNVTYIDAHYTIYPTSAGFGPYYLTFNRQFEKFTEDKGYLLPDARFTDKKGIRKELKRYMRLYKETYGYKWGFEQWQLMYMDAYYEAYEETCKDLDPWLMREKSLFNRDYLDKHFWKTMIHGFRVRRRG